jgi:hypothetical protein
MQNYKLYLNEFLLFRGGIFYFTKIEFNVAW